MTEPKHEEQGQCVAGQFQETLFTCLCLTLGVQVDIRFAAVQCAHHSCDERNPALDV